MPRRGKGVERQKLDVSSLSPMEKMFAEHSSILDEFHDTKERIYKFARDVTIVSKRIIFTLHRFGEGVEEQILKESADELHTVKTTHLQNIVKELSKSHLSYWRYIQSYSFGLQEFIEALSFMHYLKTKQLITKEEIEQQLIFDVLPEEEEKVDIKELPESKRIKLDVDHMDTSDDMGSNEKQYPTADGGIIIDGSRIHFKLSYNDYLLGIADLGGELMRYATNNVTKPSMRQVPFEIRDFLQLIGIGFLSLVDEHKEYKQKYRVLTQCIAKVEKLCSEIVMREKANEQIRSIDIDLLEANFKNDANEQ